MRAKLLAVVLFIVCFSFAAAAQSTEFVYQGQLQNSSAPASGNYDFEFRLFDSLANGLQVGSTLTRSSVVVANGIFSVKLDFGPNYPGTNRFLEIRVKQTGGGAFTPLTPRQPISSSPYSIHSLNAAAADTAINASQLGGLSANGFIQNSGIVQPGNVSFNINGNGKAALLEAGQYNLNGHRFLIGDTGGNTFAGIDAGISSLSGNRNSYFGYSAGSLSSFSSDNSFFGSSAGVSNTSGSNNTLVGSTADVASGSLTFATAIGAGSVVSTSSSIALGRSDGSDTVLVFGVLRTGLDGSGSLDVCRNASLRLSTCSSSLRYKTSIHNFTRGLNVVRNLQPITFNWIDGGASDVGFAAEEVDKIEPLLATRNEKGEIEGVKYKQISTVLVNAVNEQQAQIEAQQKQIELQRKQIESLTKIVCAINTKADICR